MKRTWILLAVVPALLSAVWAATGSRARTQVAMTKVVDRKPLTFYERTYLPTLLLRVPSSGSGCPIDGGIGLDFGWQGLRHTVYNRYKTSIDN